MNFISEYCNRETKSISNCSVISFSQSNVKWQRSSGRPAVFPSVIHLPPLKEYNSIWGSDLISRQDRRRGIKKMSKVFQKVMESGTKIHSAKFYLAVPASQPVWQGCLISCHKLPLKNSTRFLFCFHCNDGSQSSFKQLIHLQVKVKQGFNNKSSTDVETSRLINKEGHVQRVIWSVHLSLLTRNAIEKTGLD